MTGFYDGLAETAGTLLAQFGKPLTLRIQTGASFDAVNQVTDPVYQDYAVSGLVLNFSGTINEAGTIVNSLDKKIIVSVAGAPEPTTGALVIDGATIYAIQNVKPLSPAGVSVIYQLQGRA